MSGILQGKKKQKAVKRWAATAGFCLDVKIMKQNQIISVLPGENAVCQRKKFIIILISAYFGVNVACLTN